MHGVMRSRWLVYVVAGVISLLLSYTASIRAVVVNPDAICYLLSAQNMDQGLGVATHLCDQAKWPFYSILIYGMASITKLSYIHAAYLLNSLFSLISVLVFIALVGSLKGTGRVLWFAALVILLAHEFNSVREYVIRDHGFWAFYLISLLMLLRYFHHPRWYVAVAWNMSLIVATLFRIEGAIFLFLLPLITLFNNNQPFFSRLKSFAMLNVLTIGIVIFAMGLLLHQQQTMSLGRVGELMFQLQHGFYAISQHFRANANVIAQTMLNQYAIQDAMLVLFLVVVSWYVLNVISNLTLIYVLLIVYAWYGKALSLTRAEQWVIGSYVVVNVVVTAAFLLEHMFLSKRYLLALSLTLMLWVPFALENLYQQFTTRKWPFILAIVFIIIYGFGGIVDCGYSKKYMRDAGEWLASHVPSQASLYSNDYQVMYYSQHFGNGIFTKIREFSNQNSLIDKKWKQYDYIALRLTKKDQDKNAVLTELGMPVQVFMNKRGDEVIIYKIH